MKQRAVLVADLGFGDAGKGTMVEYFVRRLKSRLVVRYNGGPQALHHVVLEDGRWHGFSQFGSGTFAGAHTFLSPHVLVNPDTLLNEAEVLARKGISDPLSMVTIDPMCVVITPVHLLANQLREFSRGYNRHGSCGAGVGEARADQLAGRTIRITDLDDPESVIRQLHAMQQAKLTEFASFERHPNYITLRDLDLPMVAKNYSAFMEQGIAIASAEEVMPDQPVIVFEGAQGVLLDESHGFAPHTTWTDTTFRNADELLADAGITDREYVGVVRSYATRHGDGPFPTFSASLQAQMPREQHNHDGNPWMGAFRKGHFDAVLLDYALTCCRRVGSVAITHMDQRYSTAVATKYAMRAPIKPDASCLSDVRPLYEEVADLPGFIEDTFGLQVQYLSFGPTFEDKFERSKEALRSAA